MSDYKLAASLEGHEDDVRGVCFPYPKLVLSASRDATVRLWKLLEHNPPKYDCSISSHGSAFINAITFLPASPKYPQGLIISGGKDTIIDVREPGKSPEDNAEALLLGHSHNVCALDCHGDGEWIVSGSWDGSARVWRIGKWECDAILEGHEGSVWAVLAFDHDTIITGCADQLIRIFTTSGKLLHTVRGNQDVVRALCKVRKGHSSGADFASAGNDGVIRLWKLNGSQVGELHGHDSFIYSLSSLSSGELVSSGEDRTVRIWRGNECVQTITHPAISVWAVAVCPENGDIVSGASDRRVRVFSKNVERQAGLEALQEFEESVKSSSIPQQQVGDVNKEKLPGPEFLQQKSGTKEGQVVMIKEGDGSVTAHQWSQGAQQWMSVGTVVDAVGSSGRKKDFRGKDYDYVFDVDIEDGHAPLQLPYNLSQNPYEAATKFIQDHDLPTTYLDQVANFIITSTQGATIGQSSQPAPAGSDPWGTESRYRPGDAQSTPSQPSVPTSRPKVLPQTQYLSIKTANLKTIQKKIEELNNQLINGGSKELALNPAQVESLQALIQQLEQSPNSTIAPTPITTTGLEVVLTIITTWPPPQRLPGLDLLRLLSAATPAPAELGTSSAGEGETLVSLLDRSGVFSNTDASSPLPHPNNTMLAVRALANLFDTAPGRLLASTHFDQIHTLVNPLAKSSSNTSNRNLTIAIATLYINYAVLFTSPDLPPSSATGDRALTLLDDLASMLTTASDSEAIYRCLVAAGTLVLSGEEAQMAAKEVFDLPGAMAKAEGRVKEPRVKGVVAEIRKLLG